MPQTDRQKYLAYQAEYRRKKKARTSGQGIRSGPYWPPQARKGETHAINHLLMRWR